MKHTFKFCLLVKYQTAITGGHTHRNINFRTDNTTKVHKPGGMRLTTACTALGLVNITAEKAAKSATYDCKMLSLQNLKDKAGTRTAVKPNDVSN